MENLLTRHRNLSVLAAVLFVQVFGLAVQVKRSNDPQQTRLIRYWAVTGITPFEQAIVHAQGAVYGVWHNYLYLRGVRQENRDLKAEIERLRLEQARLTEDANQAHRLQTLLAFKEQSILHTLPAQVVGSSGSELSRSVYLDKGEDDGLKKDMAVITADGVVGKVLQVYPHTAQVLLINDQSSGLGAIVERLRLQGVVRGSAAGETILDKIMPGEEVQPGDKIITTGGDGIFPKGLPVGSVVKVSPADIFLKVRIHPSANLNRLEEVLVVTKLQDVVPGGADLAGSQRAADILSARLPGVPEKTEAEKVAAKKNEEGEGTVSAANPSHVPPKQPQNSVPQNSATPNATPNAAKPKPVAPPNATAKPPSHAPVPPPHSAGPQTKPAKTTPAPVANPAIKVINDNDRKQ